MTSTTEPGHAQARGAEALTTGTPPDRRRRRLERQRRRLERLRGDAGMTTAEYAVGTVAACAFAGLLLKVVTSATVSGLLTGVVERALSATG
ncbi:uncharacterized protein DUF4244 [Motilibacter peucedani]|uniref:Uncharacterized protein DUF4244 n=1 Tax=Motilibacter peucedani TaxID=598650 RepID=A0A420XQ28_9ACTN|nr:DUF4244 domain-containing protein [Motilibacter peucedani]RKS75357.1 uncharacterized protein DUF4244 [Motilibacter peucedani]